ncbi:MAG: C69 family dipeptidase [Melioribacteraceae bacterium]|nr:C69 family dipeptidase [Melioribacteraceae bacterium]MCF8412736.1 C69 family dipeptidase [Melioribacteraceae bacterium]
MNIKRNLIIALFLTISASFAQVKTDWQGGVPDGCTTITVGKLATDDGSVMTSHTDDSHRTRSWLDIMPPMDHPEGSTSTMYKRATSDSLAMPTYKHVPVGEIPQVNHTYGFINTAYPSMNQHQLAIGETTFGGRATLQSDNGLIDCQRLCQLMLERCKTAREAIKMADELTKEYGWIDAGEMLTIADTKEVWHFEITGAGKGNRGAIWVAQRVPDHHISVGANGSRIRVIDLENSGFFMASDNVFQVAQDSGWWNPTDGNFEFVYAYSPGSRRSLATRRREWRVLSLAAPSLKLDANAENYPFSVKPDAPITKDKMVQMFQDYYEGTPYNFIKDITWVNDSGKVEISPLANPFMPYDMNKIFKINGGWGWLGERTIARWYTMYATITQSRDWLPDEIGGVVWLAWDNVATAVYTPIYSNVTEVNKYFKTPGRINGYTHDSAWWAFNRLGTLTAQRWGDMRHDVRAVFDPMQKELFANQNSFEEKVLELLKTDKDSAIKLLTDYTNKTGIKAVEEAWKLGDFLWTKYDEKF